MAQSIQVYSEESPINFIAIYSQEIVVGLQHNKYLAIWKLFMSVVLQIVLGYFVSFVSIKISE